MDKEKTEAFQEAFQAKAEDIKNESLAEDTGALMDASANTADQSDHNEAKAEASEVKETEQAKQQHMRGKRVAVLIFVIVSALLALCCVLIYLSIMPRAGLSQQAGYYQLSEASSGDTVLSGEELGFTIGLKLDNNGWCHLVLENKAHLGRWNIEDEIISIKCLGLKLSCIADCAELRIVNLMGKELDIILEKA